MPRALVLAGGWDGHHPGAFASLYRTCRTARRITAPAHKIIAPG